MKRLGFILGTLLFCHLAADAQTRIRDVFAEMPDNILPLITKNNRLDCIDFKENNMPALVNNLVDEPIELSELSNDYLKLKMSKVSWAEMKLLPVSDTIHIICMVKTYQGPITDSSIGFYNMDWTPTEIPMPEPDVTAYLPTHPEDTKLQEEVVLQLRDLPFTKMSLSSDSQTLTLSLQPDDLPKKEKEYAKTHLKPLIFHWNGKQFELRGE